MKRSLLIPLRYFFSFDKKGIINIISFFAMLAVMLCSIALIVVLSAFNGMDSFVKNLFGKFDSDLTIFPNQGKTFVITPEMKAALDRQQGIANYSEIIEDNALLKYRDKQIVVKIKGIESTYLEHHSIDSSLIDGSTRLIREDSIPYALIGLGVAHKLNIAYNQNMYPLQFMYPKNKKMVGTLNTNLLNRKNIRFGGRFAIERQYDEYYTFIPLDFASELTQFKDKRTSIEISAANPEDIPTIKQSLQSALGDQFDVKDSSDLHIGMLIAHNVEKLFVFLIFSFILLIASLNIFFALSMLVMEKQRDIAVMKSFGYTSGSITRVYMWIGSFVSLTGTSIGLFAGLLLVLGQQEFGWISMGMNNGLIDAYPVELRGMDFIAVLSIVGIITILVSIIPARKASKVILHQHIK